MKISIVVPVYKVEAYLGRCVDSILSQSFADFELILVDDGSPDNCPQMCDEYAEKDNRIRVIHQKNGGAAAARNAGIDSAEGEWLAFIDSDDWVHPDYLKLLYDTAEEQNADVTACRYETVNDATTSDDSPMAPCLSDENRENYWINDRTGAVVPWGKLYRREIFRELRYPEGRIGEDEFVSYKVIFGCEKLAILDNPLYRYYCNAGGVSRTDYFKRLPDIIDCFTEHIEFFKDSPWQKVFRLEVEKYAEAYSEAIWLLRGKKDDESRRKTQELRSVLKTFMDTHKGMIPFEKRKDIYIAAYPAQELFIRGFGYIKGKLKK